MNAYGKWQVLSDDILPKIGFEPVSPIPQLFQLSQTGVLVAILSRVVDNMPIAVVSEAADIVTKRTAERVAIGTVTSGLGLIRFFG